MIEFVNVSKTFDSKTGIVHAVRDVNLKVEEHEIFGVIGYSGAGKSTLAKIIVGLYSPNKGELFFDDVNFETIDKKYLRKQECPENVLNKSENI